MDYMSNNAFARAVAVTELRARRSPVDQTMIPGMSPDLFSAWVARRDQVIHFYKVSVLF